MQNNSPDNSTPKPRTINIAPQHTGIVLDTTGIDTEIRRDYLHNRVVIIAPNRGKRPYDTRTSCNVLVETASSPQLDTNQETYKITNKSGDWKVKVVENKFPSLTMSNPQAFGKQELVIETPRSGVSFCSLPIGQLVDVFKAYQARINDLSNLKGIEYVLVFKNEGYEAGASLAHAHSQIFALPSIPNRIREESKTVEVYQSENHTDPYEDIKAYEKQHHSRVISSGKHFFVFCPYAPQWPFETWFMPQNPINNFGALDESALKELAEHLKNITGKLHKHQISYNFYIENGISPNQRLQIKLCGRSNIWGGYEVATSTVINTVPPESAAKWLRS